MQGYGEGSRGNAHVAKFKNFDLPRVKSKSNSDVDVSRLFRVTFDWYTPRPHFIVTLRNGHRLPPFDPSTPLSAFASAEDEFFDELVNVAESTVSNVRMICPSVVGSECDQWKEAGMTTASGIVDELARPPVVLSIHRGRWISRSSPQFHAHLCTDVDSFLNVLCEVVSKGLLPSHIPGCYVKKEWTEKPPERSKRGEAESADERSTRRSRSIEYESDVDGRCYRANVRRSPNGASKYFDKDLSAIDRATDKDESSVPLHSPIADWLTRISFHKRYARLGFRSPAGAKVGGSCASNSRVKAELLMEMERLASSRPVKNKAKDADGRHGYHLCVAVGVQENYGFQEFQRLEENKWVDSTDVLGYIQMEPYLFYHLLPDKSSRSDWYKNFAVSEEAILT